jgi:hypothetical protein
VLTTYEFPKPPLGRRRSNAIDRLYIIASTNVISTAECGAAPPPFLLTYVAADFDRCSGMLRRHQVA